MADLKAVSLNVMHANIRITDQTYSRLSEDEVHVTVEKLSKVEINKQEDLEDDFKLFEQFLQWRKHEK
jgi:formiminotetrahydrofolate cyclodeaminase